MDSRRGNNLVDDLLVRVTICIEMILDVFKSSNLVLDFLNHISSLVSEFSNMFPR